LEHKTADRPNWRRVAERTFEVTHKEDSCFKGKVTAIHIKKVTEPLVVQYKNHEVCIADTGYTWLQHFPEDEKYTITTVMDQNGEVVQFYIDMCKAHGITEEGIPWFDDLYLDIVILPDKELFLLDDNELMEAFDKGDINDKEMKLAHETAQKIITKYKNGEFEHLETCLTHASEWNREKKFT
jgi:predicted RNA-binding protein associated with RNAse of E/G family